MSDAISTLPTNAANARTMTEHRTALRIENRRGLPADIAYLLDRYPRAGWQRDASFAGMASMWLEHHDWLRDVGAMLRKATADYRETDENPADFRAFFAPRLRWFLQRLEGHHGIEDEVAFPAFRALDPRLVIGMDLLEEDHGTIHQLLVSSAGSGAALVEALRSGRDASRSLADAFASDADRLLDFLMRHLHDEEDLVIPVILDQGGTLPGFG